MGAPQMLTRLLLSFPQTACQAADWRAGHAAACQRAQAQAQAAAQQDAGGGADAGR
jgi:hypothetical protein